MGKAFESYGQRIIKAFNQEIARAVKRLQKHVEEQVGWSEKQTLFKSTPGVNNTLVYSILVDLPEIGNLSNKQIRKLAAAAPTNRDSRKFKGKRRIYGGRTGISSTFCIATLSATQCNPVIKAFYQKLLA